MPDAFLLLLAAATTASVLVASSICRFLLSLADDIDAYRADVQDTSAQSCRDAWRRWPANATGQDH